MKYIVVALFALAACKSKDKTEPAATGSGSAAVGSAAGGSAAAKPDESATDSAKGVTVHHQVGELSGSYDVAFAKVSDADHQITLALVRGCPTLTCDPGPWEAEQVAHACPKAYIATARVPGLEAGKYTLDVSFAGPMDNVSTATLESVRLELTKVDINASIEGTFKHKTTESSATGTFVAVVCPRT